MRWLSLGVVLLAVNTGFAEVKGLRIAEGFDVRKFSGEDLATDIVCMTIDERGRVWVSGPGYIKILTDTDNDGTADKVQLFSELPKDGAQGLCVEGDTLYCVGDGGLWVYKDKDDDGKADADGVRYLALPTGSDHLAHMVRRGPDGWLYWMVGDSAGITSRWATTENSPVKQPIGGCLLRISPDWLTTEIVAHGFRNAYSFDFNSKGDLFTYDSDNERCISLPWYEPTRFYHIKPGGFHGWLGPRVAQTWRMPNYFVDVVPPVAYLRRGSPTGVTCYRHTAFPQRYVNGAFASDWTFGRVWFLPLELDGATYKAKPEIFIECEGDFGFAPTASAVNPKTGELFISVGGRGTRGTVYAVKSKSPTADAKSLPIQKNDRPDPKLTKTEEILQLMKTQPADAITQAAKLLSDTKAPLKDRLHALRIVQIGIGDIASPQGVGRVWEGYSVRQPRFVGGTYKQIGKLCLDLFPKEFLGDEERNFRRELSRTMALVEYDDPKAIAKLTACLTADSDPVEDIHILIVLAKLPTARTTDESKTIGDALLALDRKLDAGKRFRDRNWPLRIAETFAQLSKYDANLANSIIMSPEFGRPDHTVFTRVAGFDRTKAARRFIEKSKSDESFLWSADLIELVAELPLAEARPILLKVADNGWTDTVLPILAKSPNEEDTKRFLDGLRSPRINIVGDCVAALEKFPLKTPEEWAELIRVLRRLPLGKIEDPIRVRIAATLQGRTGEKFGTDAKMWIEWLAKKNPELAAKVDKSDIDWPAWKTRLGKLKWEDGDAARGKKVFVKATCIACHGGNQRLGPDLDGVTKRFMAEDLFQSIVDPSKDISSRFQATQYETKDGKLYLGLPVYEAADGVLLQTGSGTVRLDGKQIESKSLSVTSLMPSGLLDKIEDGDLADLYAYLKVIGQPSAP